MLILVTLAACANAPCISGIDTGEPMRRRTRIADFADGDRLWIYTDAASDFEFFMVSCTDGSDFPCGESGVHLWPYKKTWPWLEDFVDNLVYAPVAGAICQIESPATATCPAVFEDRRTFSADIGLRVMWSEWIED